MSRRTRLLVVPVVLLVAVSGTIFVLARLHPAKAGEPSATRVPAEVSTSGDRVRGGRLFAANCATCHGEEGTGGGVGPRLAGSGVSQEEARATIENGRGVMPADLVSGQDLDDVLAYLETIAR